ncbi:MAG: DUF2914 domain-containing protein [Polyangiaceae bacterium]|nr:DUF2914 domain-containing protein [Polyangiaceae bacterium]
MNPASAFVYTTVAALTALLATSCGDSSKDASGAAAATPSGATTAAATSSAKSAKSKAEPAATGVDVLKFQLTSGVKNRDPIDKAESAKPGERLYGHVTARNRTGADQRISLSFRVNGDERSLVDLTVEKSWSWRTWAYVTLRKDDKGEVTVHVFDDHGAELASETIPISPK